MKAAVLTEIAKPLQILDLDQKAPKAGEARVRMKASGVCMSDWHLMIGDWPTKLPLVLGHEAAGIVEEIGPGPSHVSPGDHVIFSFTSHCGHCRYCNTGREARRSAQDHRGRSARQQTRICEEDGSDPHDQREE